MTAHALILAAGKGTRMGGEIPKVMVKASGKPLIGWVIDALHEGGVGEITAVVGFGREMVEEYLPEDIGSVVQDRQLGTGHAVLCARHALNGFSGTVLVTCGDMPLIRAETFAGLLKHHVEKEASCTVLTSRIAPPHRYGRIVRDTDGSVLKIVEAADATEEELAIDEINTGVYAFDSEKLFTALENVKSDNNQGEYYLPDVLEIMINDGDLVEAVVCEDSSEALGVNCPDDLSQVEAVLG